MSSQLVEAVWMWTYTDTAAKATYRRFGRHGYTKDYLQVPREPGQLLKQLFPPGPANRHELFLESPGGIREPGFVSHSSDRAHLAWRTQQPPAAWRMTLHPTAVGPATLPGDPDKTTVDNAIAELQAFRASDMHGYLVAVKLVGDGNLQLRAYLQNEPAALAFADVTALPPALNALRAAFRGNRACVAKTFVAADQLFFDPDRNHDAWSVGNLLPPVSSPVSDDAAAEKLPADPAEMGALAAQVADGYYFAPDVPVTSKSRGSQQQIFANAVKQNYGYRCALTGVTTRAFLVASHIVAWADDADLRLDPANGICLSTLADRAFDTGYLHIGTDFIARVDWAKVGLDESLRELLEPLDGKALSMPAMAPPKAEYLQRRHG